VCAGLNPVIDSEQGGLRPALVVQADPVNRHASTAIVLALTSRPQRSVYPLTGSLPAGEGGLALASRVKVNQLRTVSLRDGSRTLLRPNTSGLRRAKPPGSRVGQGGLEWDQRSV